MEAHGETRPRKRANRKLREQQQQRNADNREEDSRHSRDDEEIKLRHSFSEEEADDGASLLYKILFFVLLLALGGLATIVLIDNNNSLISPRECVEGESCSAQPDHVPVQVDGEEEAVEEASWFDWLTQEEQDHDHHHVEEFTDEPHEFHDDHDDDDDEHHGGHGGAGGDGPKQRGPEGITTIPASSSEQDGGQVSDNEIEEPGQDRLPQEQVVFVNSSKDDDEEGAPVEAHEDDQEDQQANFSEDESTTPPFSQESSDNAVFEEQDLGNTEEQVVADFAEAFSDNEEAGEDLGESNERKGLEEVPAADFYAREQLDNMEEEEDNGEIDENDLRAEFLRNMERIGGDNLDGFGGGEEDDIFDDAHEYM